MTEDQTTEETPELDAGEPTEDEPDGWNLLERLKELEADFDSQIDRLRETIRALTERVVTLETDSTH